MKKNRLIIFLLAAFCFSACENTTGSKTEETSEDSVVICKSEKDSVVTCEGEMDSIVTCESVKDSLLATIDEEKHLESLVFWAPDTACVMNPELLLLLDTLYQHVRSDEYSTSAKIEEQWMNSFRKRICAYYDRNHDGQESRSEFEKAELVLEEGARLMEADHDNSGMGMLIRNSTERTFALLSEYGLLTQMIRGCKNNRTRNLLYKEWELFEDIRINMSGIIDDFIFLTYWDGTAGIPLRSERWLDMSDSRRKMYQNILKLESQSLEDEEYYRGDAVGYFFRTISDEATNMIKDWEDDQNDGSPFMNEREFKRYQEVKKETENDIKAIRPKLNEWIKLWDRLEARLTHTDSHKMRQVASKMLIELARIAPDMEEHRY